MTPTRRGACPSLAEPMPTGDGLLVRLSPIDRQLSAAALAGLAEASERSGNGLIEITARGNLQVRGLTPASVPLFAAAVAELDIEVATGVPVETGALAGLDPSEIEDPRPLASTLRDALARSGIVSRVGPKASVVLDGGGKLHLDALPADIRLKALGRGQWSCGETTVSDPVAHVLGRLGGLAATGRKPSPASRPAAEAIGTHRLRDGRFAIGVGLPFGQIRAEALGALAASSDVAFRLAPGRAVMAVGLEGSELGPWTRAAAELGFVTEPADTRRAIAACPGCPACSAGEIPSRAMAEEIAVRAAPLLDGSLMLHVSGCAKGCAHPRLAAMSVVGVGRACELSLHGTPLARLRPSAAVAALARLAERVAQQRAFDETAADCLARLGAGPVGRMLRDHAHA